MYCTQNQGLELEFIDFGVDEVFVDEDGILLYAPFESFGAIQKELEKRDIEILVTTAPVDLTWNKALGIGCMCWPSKIIQITTSIGFNENFARWDVKHGL